MFELAMVAFHSYIQFVITVWAKLCDLSGKSSDPSGIWVYF